MSIVNSLPIAADGVQSEIEALRASESRFRALADAVPVLIASCDASRRFKFVNRPYAERLGLAVDEVVGKHVAEVLGPEAYADIRGHIDAVLQGRRAEFEVTVLHAGAEQHLHCSYAPERDAAGAVVGWFAAIVDISERKRMENGLRDGERRFRDLIDALPAAVYVTDQHGYVTHANQAAVELAGRAPRLGEDRWCVTWKLHRPDGTPLPREECLLAVALREGRAVRDEEVLVERPDGKRLHVAPYPTPLRDSDGRVVGAINMLIDITERKSAERELRVSEERYRRLAQLLPVGVYTCEAPSGVVTYYNEQAAELWGRAPKAGDPSERYCGSFRLVLPDGRSLPHEECPMALALSEGRSFRNEEVFIERPDGSRLCVLVNIDPVHDADGEIIGAINVFHDVSALKEAERAAREQRQNLRTLLDTVPVAVFIAESVDCRRITGNRAAAELLRMQPAANLAISGVEHEQPSHFRLLDAGRALECQSLPVRRAARGERVRGEEIGLQFDDGTLLNLLVSAQPLYDSQGRPRGAVATALDITTLKNAELALREADRRKDEFLATLSHELRNPLAPISTALGILDAVRTDRERFGDLTAVMERQLGRLVRLIDDLLDVSRISRGKLKLRKERIELQAIVREAVEANRLHGGGHRLELALPDRPIELDADPVRLGQVFSNLLSNATKYTPAGGTIRVSIEERNGFAEVSVADTGVGIPAEELGGIFEMFAQLEPRLERAHGGLGIGLSLARQFAELHGGTIEARSAGADRGSEFLVRLPVHERPESVSSEAERPEAALAHEPARARRILVVDDNLDAATTLSALLRMQGHAVEEAHDGAEAIERAAAWRPAVILLDIGLPVMDGYAVCRAIRATSWGKRIFIAAVTGWGQDGDRCKSADAGFDAHLVKPIDARVLTRLIDALHVGASPSRATPVS